MVDILKKIYGEEKERTIVLSLVIFCAFVVVSNLAFASHVGGKLSGSVLEPIIRWVQVVAFSALLFIGARVILRLKIIGPVVAYGLFIGLQIFGLVLFLFHSAAFIELDYTFLIVHFDFVNSVAGYFFDIFMIVTLLVAISNAIVADFCEYMFKKIRSEHVRHAFSLIVAVFVALALLPTITNCQSCKSELVIFVSSVYGAQEDRVIHGFEALRDDMIAQKVDILSSWDAIDATEIDVKKNLENIIIVEMESLNKFAISPEVTPNYLALAQKGIRFDRFYSNGVQTIYGQGSLLCSLPSSFHGHLESVLLLKDQAACLPQFLNRLGYYSQYYDIYDLDFANTGSFMEIAGYDEAHDSDIMVEGDRRLKWGYSDDIFLQRIFEHVRADQYSRRLIHFKMGAAHHVPFEIPGDNSDPVLYPHASDAAHKFLNTLHIQDSHLAYMWEQVVETFPEGNFTVIITGDHGYPAGLSRPGNTYYRNGAYEENYLTNMLFIFGDTATSSSSVVISDPYSQMDFLPTVLDLFGVEYPWDPYAVSFHDVLVDDSSEWIPHRIFMVQPYNTRILSVLEGDVKYQYEARSQELRKMDISVSEDRFEMIAKNQDAAIDALDDVLLPIFAE